MSRSLIAGCLLLVACHEGTNVKTAADYQAALEQCLVGLFADIQVGEDRDVAAARYEACATAADKKFGKR